MHAGSKPTTTLQSRDQAIYYVAIGVTSIIMGARLFSRVHIEAGLRADDWTMIAAFVSFIAVMSTIVSLPHRYLF